jgi:hypothetical protein
VPPLPVFSDAFPVSPDSEIDARCCSESPSFQSAHGPAKEAWGQRRVRAQEPVGAPAGRLGEVGSAPPAILAGGG